MFRLGLIVVLLVLVLPALLAYAATFSIEVDRSTELEFPIEDVETFAGDVRPDAATAPSADPGAPGDAVSLAEAPADAGCGAEADGGEQHPCPTPEAETADADQSPPPEPSTIAEPSMEGPDRIPVFAEPTPIPVFGGPGLQ